MRKALLCFLLLALCISALPAQEADWYVNKPIKDIKFIGLDRISATELEGIIKPFIGKPFTDPILLDIQRRLYALEYFEFILPDITPASAEKSAAIIVLTVKERSTISDIQIRGNSGVRTSEILNEVTVKTGTVFSKSKINTDIEAIKRFYYKTGYASVQVEYLLEDPSDKSNPKLKNSKVLVYKVDEGFKNTIKKIQFSGNKFATEQVLRGLLKSKEQALLEAGLYQDENLELDKQAIIKYYTDNGFVDAKLIDVKKTSEDDSTDKRRYITIVFYIEEGEQWNFGGLEIKGNEIFTIEQLMAKIRSKSGNVLNYSRVQSEFQQIVDMYTQNGYINNGFNIEEKRNKDNKSITYQVTIVERGRSYIENIIIRGNTKTKTETILREIPFETGDIFSAKRIREGLLNLTNRRFFTANGIVPETPQGSAPGLYNLILNVTEGQTMDLKVGFAISGSTTFPLSGFIKWSELNFLGNGQEISAELNISVDDFKIVGSFTDPWLFGPNWSGGVSLTFDRSIIKNYPQDRLGQTFTGQDASGNPNGVPDPFTGQYLKPDGSIWPGNPTPQEIQDNHLQTDYAAAGGINAIVNSPYSLYNMQYTNTLIQLGVNTGKVYRTPVGRFIWSVNGSVGINLVEYDASQFRPWSESLRKNWDQFLFQNRIGFELRLDNRDVIFDPSNGYLVSQAFTYTGGILGGSRNYIRSDSRIEGYLTLWDIPVTETDNFKTVLAASTSLAVMLKQFDGSFVAEENLLYTNQMMIARGWNSRTLGQALFNSWIELRTPIVVQTLSLDIYAEAVSLVNDRDKLFSNDPTRISEDWMFGIGIGLRVISPSLPLRLYLAKRFNFNTNGTVNWQPGNLGSLGLDLIFAFSLVN